MAGIKSNVMSSLGKDLKYVFSKPNVAANNAVDASRWYVRAGEKFGGQQHAMNIRKAQMAREAAANDLKAANGPLENTVNRTRENMRLQDGTSSRAERQRQAMRDQETEMGKNREAYTKAIRDGKATRLDMAREGWNMYNAGTASQRAMKYGATAAAYGVLAGGGRALSGGSLTTTSDGRRDIAGIPFV